MGKIYFTIPTFYNPFPHPQQDGLLLHEVLHAALLHVLRRGVRDAQRWNIAADIVVNGIISQQGCFELPAGGIRDIQLENFSVEEIYELLQQQGCDYCLGNPDLLETSPLTPLIKGEGNKTEEGLLSEAQKAQLEAHWRNAMQQAAVIAPYYQSGEIYPQGWNKGIRRVRCSTS